MQTERSSFERFIVSDERQAQSAAPGAWQLSTRLLAVVFFLIGAGWVQGAALTGQPGIAALVALAFFALVVWKLDPTDWYVRYMGEAALNNSLCETLSEAHRTTEHALKERNATATINRTLSTANTELRHTCEQQSATIARQAAQLREYASLIERFTDHAAPTTIYGDAYTGKTEALEV